MCQMEQTDKKKAAACNIEVLQSEQNYHDAIVDTDCFWKKKYHKPANIKNLNNQLKHLQKT